MSASQLIFAAGIVVIVLMGVGFLWFWKQFPPEVPWLYSMPWGEQQLIKKEWFAGMLGGLLGLFVLTRMIAEWIGKNDEISKNVILGGGLLTVVMYFLGFFRVISIILGI